MTTEALYKLYAEHPVICTDTRKITTGCLFFALKGENFDGNIFAEKALDDGAAFAIIDQAGLKKDERYIVVPDVLKALQDLARFHRCQFDFPVIGITGTNGKTTTKELFKSVLSQKFRTYATTGNLNNHIGVPLTLLSLPKDTELAIIEMGANHKKEIEFLCTIARPTHGLITNVGKAHLEGFGGFEGVKKAKGELYSFLKANDGVTFINQDNPHLMEMYGSGNGRVVRYGTLSGDGVKGKIVENDPFLTIDWFSGERTHRVKTNLTGTYNLENIVAAITVGLFFELSEDQINAGINSYIPGNNRSQIIKTESNTLICDYYNANPSSMAVAIDNLAAISANKKTLILGDMFELGEDAAAEHKAVLDKALSIDVDERIFVGKEFYHAGNQNNARFYMTTEDAFNGLKDNPITNSVVLIKGSRSMKMETLVELL
ncbi:UDP-N-acetylmuramoyl-tripeptide--D-alanyl-D-alanine ligase [Arcticibacter tournemirensis]